MLPIILAIIALVSWGTADIFGGLVGRKINGYSVGVWTFIINSILATLIMPFMPINSTITTTSLIIMILLGALGILPFMMLYESINKGNASINGTIAAAYGVVSILIAAIFLHSKINVITGILILFVFVGVVLVSINFKSTSLKTIFKDKGVPYALMACLLWGIYYAFIKIPISTLGWFIPAYVTWLTFPIGILYMKIRKIPLVLPPTNKLRLYQLLNALLILTGIFAFNYALTLSSIPIVVGISSGYPLLFVIIASLVFKDKLDKQQLIGLIIGLIGIIGLGFIG